MNNELKKEILIIAPLTPPYTGNALPVKYIFDKFSISYKVKLINLSKGSFKSGLNSYKRIFQIIIILAKVIFYQKGKNLIYLTVAESTLGNLRDIVIYLFTFFNNKKIVIHLLGGNSMKQILSNKNSLYFWLNKFFISRLGGVIVEGQFQANFFNKLISNEKIHIIHNFAQHFLYLSEEKIQRKFTQLNPIRILFLSNLIYGKGHYELLDAFLKLEDEAKLQFQVDFAGSFETDEEKIEFENKIKPCRFIKYWGHVSGELKTELFKNAHIFCLPSYYPFEGQPFVLVEAYAAGCAVITTNHSGIGYIFKDKQNGIEVEKESVEDLKRILYNISLSNKTLIDYALFNNKKAKELYTEDVFLNKINNVFKIHLS